VAEIQGVEGKVMKRYWIKLYLEILNDPKMGQLPDWLWRRAIELFLLAGENGNDGLLQPVSDLAWRLRPCSVEQVAQSLDSLSKVGVVHETPDGWVVTNFAKRQEAVDSTERVRQFRKRERNVIETKRSKECNENETNKKNESVSISSSSSVSLSEEGGMGGETIDNFFTDSFGSFNGDRERKRWRILFEAIGKDRAKQIAAWAEKKEIHMTNRGALLDSLETAAKKWTGDGKKNNRKYLSRREEVRAKIDAFLEGRQA
jgi:hypothetical protein